MRFRLLVCVGGGGEGMRISDDVLVSVLRETKAVLFTCVRLFLIQMRVFFGNHVR